METYMITVKMGTEAQTCNAQGVFSNNMRPLPFPRDTKCEVLDRGFNGKFTWYVVRVYSACVFVTSQDIRY